MKHGTRVKIGPEGVGPKRWFAGCTGQVVARYVDAQTLEHWAVVNLDHASGQRGATGELRVPVARLVAIEGSRNAG